MIPLSHLLVALSVLLARVADVSLGTFRHAMVIRGKKYHALLIAFAESLIWIFAVSRVLGGITDPLTAIAFAVGFAVGTFVGILIEDAFKIGEQVVRIFSNEGAAIASLLRNAGHRVTSFDGSGRDGAVQLLFVQARRKDVAKICDLARSSDPRCYLVIDDIRAATYGNASPGK